MHQRDLSDSLSTICEAALDPGYWNDALDGIVAMSGATACILNIVGRTQETAYDISALSRVYREFTASEAGIHYLSDLRPYETDNWIAFATQPAGEPFDDSKVGMTVKDFETRPDCVWLERHTGVRRRLCARLTANGAWFDGMAVGFDKRYDTIPEAGFRALSPMLPLLGRTIELGRTFLSLRERYNAVLGVLDRVGVGMAIALPDGQVIIHNSECARILAMDDGLELRADRRFRCHRPEEAAELGLAVAAAAATAKGEENHAETLMTVTRPSGAQKLLVDVAPLRESGRELDFALEGAVITLIDPTHSKPLRIDNFIKLYALTPTEAAVCELMMQGFGLEEIAERRGRSPVTVKNQVASILSKCGVRSRSEMLRLAVRILPPLE